MTYNFAGAGVQREGTAFTLSTMSNKSLEDVAQAVPGLLAFFQLYVFKDRKVKILWLMTVLVKLHLTFSFVQIYFAFKINFELTK